MVEVTRSLSTFLFDPLVAKPGRGLRVILTHRPSSSPVLATSLNCRRCRRRPRRRRRRKVVVVVDLRHHFNPVVVFVVALPFLGLVPAGR